MVRGPPLGYFPEPTNSILVISPWNVLRVDSFFLGCRLQIVTGGRYIGVFVGSKAAQDFWLGDKVEG